MFVVLYLDNQNRLLEHETLFLGTINSTEVHPREIVKSALRHNAAAVILAHNHPSGVYFYYYIIVSWERKELCRQNQMPAPEKNGAGICAF